MKKIFKTKYFIDITGVDGYFDDRSFDSLLDAREYSWNSYLYSPRFPAGDYRQLCRIVRVRYDANGNALSYYYCKP